jgi:hypothetical protein
MSYNDLRLTVSKEECECTICGKIICRGESVYIIPRKMIAHKKCYKDSNEKVLRERV